MDPVTLRSERLVLSPPDAVNDAERVFAYCQDPLFERYLSTPWPYRRVDAEYFLGEIVPSGWRLGREFIWALRARPDGPLLGIIGAHRRRATEPSSLDLGFWLGAPHRGQGYMAEAARTVTEWAFRVVGSDTVYWECAVGNLGSAKTARSAGFRYTGVAPAQVADRDGRHPPHWQGRRDRDRDAEAATAGSAAAASESWPPEVAGR